MKNLFAGLLAVVVSSGCVAHVVLPLVPAKGAPAAEREAAFKELSPVAASEAVPAPWSWGSSPQQFVLLNNGLRVMDAIDLLPAVDPGSPTAEFARAATTKTEQAHVAHGIGFGIEAVGLGLMLSSLAVRGPGPNPLPSDASFGLIFGGAGVALLALIPAIIGMVLQLDAMTEQRSAFLMYPKDLRKRLALGDELALPAAPPSLNLVPQVVP